MTTPPPTLTVAVVAPRYDQIGGMQNYARRVVDALQADPLFDVIVISTRSGLRTVTTADNGVPLIRLGSWFTLSNTPISPLWPVQLRRLFRRLDVAVVNAHSPVPFLADMAVLAAGRTPALVTYHAGSMLKGTGGLVDRVLALYERTVLPRVFARARRTIAVSPVALNAGLSGATIVPPGVDTALFAPVNRQHNAPKRIAFVGRIEHTSRWKGLQVLLEAMPAAVATHPDLVLDVIGDGDDLPVMHEQADVLGVGANVVWHGSLDHAALTKVLPECTAVVLPSLTDAESFGMTLIEAMASGCAVIGSNVGGIPFVVRDEIDGLLTPPGDVAALTQAITRILDDPALAQRLATNGRQAAISRWDVREQQAVNVTIVKQILGIRADTREVA